MNAAVSRTAQTQSPPSLDSSGAARVRSLSPPSGGQEFFLMLTNAQTTQREPELPAPLPPPDYRADAAPPAERPEAPRPEAPPADTAHAERQAEQPEEETAAAEPAERPAADAQAAAADATPARREETGTAVDGRTGPQRQETAAAAETGEKRAAAAADTAQRAATSAGTAAAAGETAMAQMKRQDRAREAKRDARTGSPEPGQQAARRAQPEASTTTPKAADAAVRQPQAVDRTSGQPAAAAVPAAAGKFRDHSPIVHQQEKRPAAEARPTAVGPAAAPVVTQPASLAQQVAVQQAASRLAEGTAAAATRTATRSRAAAPAQPAPQAVAALLAAAPQSTRHLQRGPAAAATAAAAERGARGRTAPEQAPRVEVIDRRPAAAPVAALSATAAPAAPAAPAIPVPLPLFTAQLAVQATQAQAARTATKAVDAAGGPKAASAKSADSAMAQAADAVRTETAPARTPPPVIAATRAELTRVISEVVRDARVTLSEGRTEVQLQLKPEALGRLQLKLEFAGDTLSARVITETQAAKQAVEQQLDGLLRQFAEQGLQVTAFNVEVGQQFRPPAQDTPAGGSGRTEQQHAADDGGMAETVAPRLQRRYDGQVEYLV